MKYVYMSFESKVSCCLESQTSIESNINQTFFLVRYVLLSFETYWSHFWWFLGELPSLKQT